MSKSYECDVKYFFQECIKRPELLIHPGTFKNPQIKSYPYYLYYQFSTYFTNESLILYLHLIPMVFLFLQCKKAIYTICISIIFCCFS